MDQISKTGFWQNLYRTKKDKPTNYTERQKKRTVSIQVMHEKEQKHNYEQEIQIYFDGCVENWAGSTCKKNMNVLKSE